MLKHLRIQNVILVEDASISFSTGLNILTGETGSGKTAIMQGLKLAIGERSDSGIIRKGADKGVVEAVFDPDQLNLSALLIEGGIDYEPGQDLIIRREISLSGKNRIFINNQAAQLAFLKKLGHSLAQIVSQQANQNLYSIDYHRHILDLYGNLSYLNQQYKSSYEKENMLRKQLQTLIQQESQRLREIDICQRELEELEEAHIKEGEDEELFTEYTYLVNAEELSQKIYEVNQGLSGERQAVIASLNRQKQLLEAALLFDPKLQDTVEAFQNALTEIQEIAHTLRNYQGSLHYDSDRLHQVNERLTLLNRLKRKYGSTVEEVMTYQEQTKNKLETLLNADLEIDRLKEELAQAEQLTNQYADELSNKRKSCAEKLQGELTQELHFLNMPRAQFEVQVTEQKRTVEGQDKVEFFLHPNFGENRIALREGASGGEVSRVLLALQALLAGKERHSLLIFDEVDSNIGGETAALIGGKLREISKQHQVICITHFPQVANCADYHLQIFKEERAGRTMTIVRELDSHSKLRELARMAGKSVV